MPEKGTLYVCATPIGNLGDITLRVLETLKEVDVIAAEDTRHSGKLLQHYGIKTPMVSYHEHNEKSRAEELIRRLKAGEAVALISDAGLPGISDPGGELIRRCIVEQIPVDVLPGANAALTALVLSGLPSERFTFYGFLPAARGERRKQLEEYARDRYTQIFYEAPHRLVAVLEDMFEIWGDREACVVRELTKRFQQVHRGTLTTLIAEFKQTPPKGECCILLPPRQEEVPQANPETIREEVRSGIAMGLGRGEAMKEVARKYGLSKRDVYRMMLDGE